MFFKRGIAAVLAAVTVFGLAGCGGSNDAATAEGTENTTKPTGFVEKKVEPVNFESGVELTDDCYHFIYALGNAPATIDAAKFFKMRLEQESKGTLSCDIYTDNVLGSERELLEGCQFGNYDIILATNATVASFDNDIFCLDIPWLFDNKEQVYEVLDGPLGDRLAKGLESKGFKLLQWQENSFRTLSTNKKIEKMSDLEGIKIRIMENELQLQQWKNYGANPTPMAFTELFTALQQKTVDAQDNGAELTWQTKFYEVQSYTTDWAYSYGAFGLVFNKAKWDSFDDNTKALIEECAKEVIEVGCANVVNNEEAQKQMIIDYEGNTLTELSEEEIQVFKDKLIEGGYYEYFLDLYGEDAYNAFGAKEKFGL